MQAADESARAHSRGSRFRISAVMMVMALGLVAFSAARAHSLHGSRPSVPPKDYRLTVYALGAWQGDFSGQQSGDGRNHGGLAALHTIIEARRRDGRIGERGGVLLVQSGDFTGARTAQELVTKLQKPTLNVLRYMGFDGLGGSARETLLYDRLSRTGQRGFERSPALSFNFRPGTVRDLPAPAAASAGQHMFRLVQRDDYTAMLSAVTSGTEPGFDTQPTDLLAAEFRRQSGVDLFVLMLDRQAAPKANDSAEVDTHDWHAMPAPKPKPAEHLNAIRLLEQRQFWERFFPLPPGPGSEASRTNPYALPPSPFARRWLIIESSAESNRFRRLTEGPYLCSIANRSVCEVTFEFRDHRVRGVRARFIDVNSPQTVGGWQKPDERLTRALVKP